MKTLFIEARSDMEFDLKDTSGLPKKLAVFSSVQYLDALAKTTKELEKRGFIVSNEMQEHAKHKGQILGCSISRIAGVDGILYIGDGNFHPLALSIRNEVPVFVCRLDGNVSTITDDMTKKFRKQKEIALKKFYMSENVGILVSFKPGQNRLKQAFELKARLDKKCYILAADNIDFSGLENFPFIDCFVNTACPRISFDEWDKLPRPVLWIGDVP